MLVNNTLEGLSSAEHDNLVDVEMDMRNKWVRYVCAFYVVVPYGSLVNIYLQELLLKEHTCVGVQLLYIFFLSYLLYTIWWAHLLQLSP